MFEAVDEVALVWRSVGDTVRVVTPQGTFFFVVVDWLADRIVLLDPEPNAIRSIAFVEGLIKPGQSFFVRYDDAVVNTDLGVVSSVSVRMGASDLVKRVLDADRSGQGSVIAEALLAEDDLFAYLPKPD